MYTLARKGVMSVAEAMAMPWGRVAEFWKIASDDAERGR